MKTHNNLVSKIVFAVVIASSANIACAQWAVIDAANFKQTTITAADSIRQTAKQLEQYKKQLEQYQDQIRNSIAPAKYLWDEANATVEKIQKTANTLNEIKRQAGNIDQYLKGTFGTVEDYVKQKCYTSVKCTKREWDEINNKMAGISSSQKRATEAMLRGLEEHEELLQKDAAKLVKIQASAQTAEGRLEAMGYANQLASASVSQLIQLRSVIMAQQIAGGMRQRALEDQEAQQRAVGEQLREGEYEASSGKVW